MTINIHPPEATTYKPTHGSEEEDYPVVDYESDLQTNMLITVR
uniref:Ulp1 protease-like n=1 Tax=Oryza glaberrima TaxID=4538 RepID=I1QXF8_ORYGL